MTDPVTPVQEESRPAPLTEDEIRNYRIAYGVEIDLMREVLPFVQHRTVPGKGYQCSGNPCRCGLDALLQGLEGRERVSPPAPLNAWEQRQQERKAVSR